MAEDHRRRHSKERAADGWFMRKNVDAGAAYPSFRQRLRQRVFVDDAAAGRIDHDCSGLSLTIASRFSSRNVSAFSGTWNVTTSEVCRSVS